MTDTTVHPGEHPPFADPRTSCLLYVVDDANQLEPIDVNTGRVMGAGINLPL
jgi:hypothetical protein